MYTEAVQGAIMFLGMIFLLVFTYWMFGGVSFAHTTLTNMAPLFSSSVQSLGGTGWFGYLLL